MNIRQRNALVGFVLYLFALFLLDWFVLNFEAESNLNHSLKKGKLEQARLVHPIELKAEINNSPSPKSSTRTLVDGRDVDEFFVKPPSSQPKGSDATSQGGEGSVTEDGQGSDKQKLKPLAGPYYLRVGAFTNVKALEANEKKLIKRNYQAVTRQLRPGLYQLAIEGIETKDKALKIKKSIDSWLRVKSEIVSLK